MWVRIGSCNQCGWCCDTNRSLAIASVYKKHGVDFVMADTFPCNHAKGGKCDIYDKRPQYCRNDWPLKPNDLFDYPECSYKFIKEKE